MNRTIKLSYLIFGLLANSLGAQQLNSVPAPLTISFEGQIQDTSLHSDSLEVVLLETGENHQVHLGEIFQLQLPLDTVWNICVLAPKTERCYLVHRQDSTLQLKGVLLNDNRSVTYSESYLNELEKRYTQVDTLSSKSNADSLLQKFKQNSDGGDNVEQEPQEGMTKLRKVVLNIKKRPKRSLGQSTISAKNIKRMPSLAEADVVKALQALPGVVASSDFSSKIYVRGGGSDQNLFLFDNGVVYSPVHFFGLFSTFLVDGIDKVDFYKGGFSSQYGDRLSSVVDIKTKNGGYDSIPGNQFDGSFLVSTFASTLDLEGRLGPVSVQVTGRSTYIKQMLELMRWAKITDLDLDYGFTDLQGSVDYNDHQGSDWKLSFYTGSDSLNFSPIVLSWGNTVVPLNYIFKSEDWQAGATVAYSSFNQLFDLASIESFVNNIQTLTVKPWWSHRITDNTSLLLGTEFQFNKVVFNQTNEILSNPGDSSTTSSNTQKDGGDFNLMSPYVEWKLSDWNNWDFNLGLRLDYEYPLNDIGFEPRLSATYHLADHQKLDFHIGHYLQYINSIQFTNMETINEFYYPSIKTKYNTIEPSSSNLFSLGWSSDKIMDQWETSVEGYYKTINNMINYDPTSVSSAESSDPGIKLGDYLVPSQGYSYGFETSLRRNQGVMTGGISYSYGRSVMKEGSQVFFADWDKPQSVKVDMSINWFGSDALWSYAKPQPGRYFRSSSMITWTSGLPYTSVLGFMNENVIDQGTGKSVGGPDIFFSDNVSTPNSTLNGDRYPIYFRWDIKPVDWGVEGKWNFSWTIINITNHFNVFLYSYNKSSSPPQRITIGQFPFLPIMLSYQRYF